jgi:hypothetical protein
VATDDDPRLLVHLNDEEGQGLVAFVLALVEKDPPELLSVYGVIGLLKVDEGCISAPPLALPWVDLG